MPGYKEPPKGKDEVRAPIPVPSTDANSRSYVQHENAEAKK